jgi:hypothetical protein
VPEVLSDESIVTWAAARSANSSHGTVLKRRQRAERHLASPALPARLLDDLTPQPLDATRSNGHGIGESLGPRVLLHAADGLAL